VELKDQYELGALTQPVQQAFMTLCSIDTSTPGKLGLKTSTGDAHEIQYDAKNGLWRSICHPPKAPNTEVSKRSGRTGRSNESFLPPKILPQKVLINS